MGAEGGDAPATVCAAMVTTHTVVVQDVHTLSIVRSFWTMSLSRLLLALCAVLLEVHSFLFLSVLRQGELIVVHSSSFSR